MALSRGRPNELPPDAVIIDANKAMAYEWQIISKWDQWTDVYAANIYHITKNFHSTSCFRWSLRYSGNILAGLALGTSVYVNNHFRRKLNLGSYGRVSTYLPIVVMPALFSLASHKLFVQRDIILKPFDICSTCVQVRAAAIQTGFGVLYPTVMAPIAACMFATRHYTYRLPSITDDFFNVVKLLLRFTKPITTSLTSIAISQALIALYLTYKEQQQHINLIIQMQQFEKEMEQKLNL